MIKLSALLSYFYFTIFLGSSCFFQQHYFIMTAYNAEDYPVIVGIDFGKVQALFMNKQATETLNRYYVFGLLLCFRSK